jgi:signal peptidase I
MIKITKKLVVGAFLNFFEWVFICTAVFFIVYVFVGQLMIITGNSMYPTFKNGEKLVMEKLSVKYKPAYRGEILIFKQPTENILVIKRVVGLPGDKVAIQNDTLYINGQIANEPYLQKGTNTQPGKALEENKEYEIPADSYMILGDNRSDSIDSRQWGFLTRHYITGRVFIKF